MGPIEAFELGGVEILVGIRMLVMMAMMSRPPEGTLLGRHAAEKSEAELEKATCFIAAMGKITVKSAANTEFTNEKHEGAKRGGLPIDTGPDDAEAHQMDANEKQSRKGDIKVAMHRTSIMRQTGPGTT